jgi:hypothetical protein
MKCQLLIITLFTVVTSCKATPGGTPVPMLEFKPGMISKTLYKGQIKDGRRWKDKRGENIIILTQSGVYWEDVVKAYRGGKLYAYHFIRSADSTFKEAWKLTEVVGECAFDVKCDFFANSLTVTDLDGDGIAEVTFAYATGCRLGVDPDDKTLVFYEGANLFKIKGTTSVIKGKEKLGGAKQVEKKFDEAPDAFREFANKQWNKFGEATAAK